ncbi:Importin beta [Lecanosticta acicola]|uniref:Importin beta n=1 Tax=Lecanosticta acicola TaxID=111012 RepID=A0AAI9E9M1_9PEZI|nr:Importin beta [Lecanosticta acicola]
MPSFSIEVSGEANPLTEHLLVQTLQSASSSDPHQIQTGTKQLAQWERSPGYYRHLQSAYIDTRLPIEIRYLAVIQLKNGIDKYWRKTATNAVCKEDKEVIRSRLIESVLNESDNRLALQDALVIAKIARYEFPNDWPEAISGFVGSIQSPNTPPLQLARALLTLLHIIKELSTGRLQRTRQHLQVATPEVVAAVGTVYARLVEQWMNAPNATDMQQSLLAIKVLRRLVIFGYEYPNRDSDVTSFWSLSQQHLGAFINLVSNSENGLAPDSQALLGKHTLQLAKLHHEMARDHPAAFALLPNSLQLTQSYWGLIKDLGNVFGAKDAVLHAVESAKIGTDGDAEEKPFTEKIALKGLLLIRACVKMVHNPVQTFKYRTPQDKEEKRAATEFVRHTLLTEAFVREAMETMVTRFFVFRASDLREWLEEPEEWEKREEGDGEDWEFSVRSCSEKLFLDLAINYKDIIVEPLLRVFYSVANPQNEDVLFKDSVYTAIGLSASVVHQHLDFDAFIRDVLVAEVQKTEPGWNILRRRAAILLAQWIGVKVSDGSRPIVYQIFQHLLNAEDALNDEVVRVTAGRQFMNIANDWEFQPEHFLPYAQTILTQLMQLIGEVELTDTKMALLNTISVIVERLDQHITPYAERIVTLLPGLWEESGEEHLMKQAILTILARLVNAMKSESLPLHSLVYPIIKGAVEPGSETQVYLLEDALDLWGAILVQTPSGSASPELMDLVQYLYPIYELGSENLRKSLEITESYVILAPHQMLSAGIRSRLFISLTKLLGSLRPDANGLVCNLVETILRYARNEEVAASLPLGNFDDAASMITWDLCQASDPVSGDVGFLPKLLQGLRGSWVAHCTTGPNAKEAPVDGIVETDYFAILARAILGPMDGFLYACQAAASAAFAEEQPLTALMKWLLEEWFSHFENIGDPSRRKLMCLALTKLLETDQTFIYSNLQSLITMWTDVVTELREDAADVGGDSLVYRDDGAARDGAEAPEDARRRALTYSDDVHRFNMTDTIRHYLQQAITICGGYEQFQEQWLVNVDKDVVKAFSELGII